MLKEIQSSNVKCQTKFEDQMTKRDTPEMGRMGVRLMHKGQRGLTLVELVIVVALAGIVSVAIVATTFQVFTFSALASNQMTAIRQVQQAGFWVSPDVMMAQDIELGASSGFPLTLEWTDLETDDVHQVVYTLEDMGNGLNKLVRAHYITPEGEPTALELMVVAEYIADAGAGTSFVKNIDDDGYKLGVRAEVGKQSEDRTYEVQPRVGAS
jgi:prepilin-type N-terminal cleavage/methylation domain-containing protein